MRSKKSVSIALLVLILLGYAPLAQSQSRPFLVVIDAGHGGHDSGAIGYYGTQEKDVNLTIARFIRLMSLYDPEISVILTRSDDRYVPHRERTGLANRLNADLFVSIHANAHPRHAAANGIEVLVSDDTTLPTYPQSRELALLLQKRLTRALDVTDRGIKHQRLFIRWAQMPAVLVEVGFLTNPSEELKLRSFTYQWTVAEIILQTVKEYLRRRWGPR
ncbi:MAG: N-acetylmuramoyl-L-alanine amidase [Candidatus Bipolaricaulota bacterium]|nr:N-acetylmuramoyl-L-alanine amidase [Candidatus Bipolaricaulota bacterium]MCS7274958.1 N-acetylmuramoyl-L-alanine amidase [Candidatus Bipolaricaulota bacterium]MDW8110202.1 N-acetylmuramoyl-L-alanine amidase [Candidatus Bipolaricaulota bacterium]MDW8329716.1 N-acetylmuramoyl-L-alanine amidase [Candidatus Bipolaricaulota bacterium]